ncbi:MULTISPECIES: RloB family protein [unclassified Pseudomonas]|uniref:RloB family protein n=1 Tax=unclassified Pseudomonas TaxID=196821 RepID=UPI001473F25E|nr:MULTISPECIES: RloB family protein [unclassified Pseudomonas]NMX92669.1 RloB domain-containing protein [Pseudomonas sp. WS 5086]NMY47443.1 RloB domain-containing protein [Pseudomonas sp. WS 5027]
MGTDNIHHRKKAQSFERKKPVKEAGKRFLIVCEGEKTEPNYFKEIRHDLRLQTATVEICGECGSDPISVYQHAVDLFEKEKGASFDTVFCIIDKDSHKNLDRAIGLINAKEGKFVAVLSYPCFEYWLLLHHVLHRESFVRTAKKSIGESVFSELKKHDKSYAKGGKGVWLRYKEKLSFAINNSREMKKVADASGNPNPSTNVHELVELLTNLNKPGGHKA